MELVQGAGVEDTGQVLLDSPLWAQEEGVGPDAPGQGAPELEEAALAENS